MDTASFLLFRTRASECGLMTGTIVRLVRLDTSELLCSVAQDWQVPRGDSLVLVVLVEEL